MYVHVCIYIYIYMFHIIHTYTYTYISDSSKDVYMYMYIHIYMYTYICICVYIYLYTYKWFLKRKAQKNKCGQVAAYCVWSVISSISNLNRKSISQCLFCHVLLKIDQWDWHRRLQLKDTPNAIIGKSRGTISFLFPLMKARWGSNTAGTQSSLIECNACQWVGEWVDGWVGGWVGEWVGGWVGGVVCVRARARVTHSFFLAKGSLSFFLSFLGGEHTIKSLD